MSSIGVAIGSIKHGYEIGKNDPHNFIYVNCPICGRNPRWVNIYRNKTNPRCYNCHMDRIHKLNQAREKNYYWRGGQRKNGDGYIEIRINPNSPYFPMAEKSGYIKAHRLIMAQHIGRCLLKQEIVHHRNGVRDDNKIENLELLSSQGKHNVATLLCRNCQLIKEIRLLRLQVKNLQELLQYKLEGDLR